MTAETFAAMLKRLRVGAGLSQNQLARQAGVDPAYVNRVERDGTRTSGGRLLTAGRPTRAVILALAEALDCGPGQADRLLHASGLATETDWQARAIAAEVRLAAVRDALAEDDAEPTFIRRKIG